MQLSFGNYYPGDSFLHRLDPRIKLCFSLVFMIIIFTLNSVYSIALYSAFLFIITILAKISFKKLFRSLKAVIYILLFAFILNILTAGGQVLWKFYFITISVEGLILGFRLAFRLGFLVMTSSLFLTLVTTPIAIADAIEALFKPLQKFGFPSHELAMMMSIALRFVPTLSQETDKIMKAQASRGAMIDTGNILQRVKAILSVLIPLFISAFKRAEDLALAMEARCYTGGENRTKLRSLILTTNDYLVLMIFSLFAVLLLFFDRLILLILQL